jgi:uncharacterized protein YndB with AHSA1/START domain
MTTSTENTIDRTLTLKASLDKAWDAVATPEGFAGWFTCRVEGEWTQGNAVKLHWPSGSVTEIRLDRIEPKSVFAYKWHPGGYSALITEHESELTTVTMALKEIAGGTELHLTESGFENIPDERRLEALGMNTEGWVEEMENIRKYVEA